MTDCHTPVDPPSESPSARRRPRRRGLLGTQAPLSRVAPERIQARIKEQRSNITVTRTGIAPLLTSGSTTHLRPMFKLRRSIGNLKLPVPVFAQPLCCSWVGGNAFCFCRASLSIENTLNGIRPSSSTGTDTEPAPTGGNTSKSHGLKLRLP